ncbi:MerR family transcriptional regulator [Bacillus horti]|uniref:DNA-binding transcriptional MerR regulator n=2 Tax=Caldalkalibacillus horti TaxID=77523 RepID=A0ABT9VVN2_9BACI|nr:MerR family transcriptional regulator [Bacillus horti]MDQ0164960.1 DNA-binding transcriptional MerR regulator [Bacillus horti]
MMTIEAFSKRSGLSKSTLRYYESEGLLQTTRGENGYRLFSEDQIHKAQLIQSLRLADVPISEIKRYLHAALPEREQLKQGWIEELRRKHQLLGIGLQYLESSGEKESIFLVEHEAETIIWFAEEAPMGGFNETFFRRGKELRQVRISYHNTYLKYLSGLNSVKALVGFGISKRDLAHVDHVHDIYSIENLPSSVCLTLPFTEPIFKIAEAYKALVKYAYTHEWIAAGPIIEKYKGADSRRMEILLPVAKLHKMEGKRG